jgi:AraC-like DNA-binding protein
LFISIDATKKPRRDFPRKLFEMISKLQNEVLQIWRPNDLPGVELRRGIAVKRPVPRHWHEDLQLCFVHAGDSEMNYRGVNHSTPPGSLFVVHPGEVHSNRVFEAPGCSYQTVYIDAAKISDITLEIKGRREGIPFLREAVIFDSDSGERFLEFCSSIEHERSKLQRETLLRDLLTELVIRYSESAISFTAIGNERRAVQQARDYLTDNYAKNISLEELASVTQMSPFHFNRVFRREVGMPPHAFQIQVRVLKARDLLQKGAPISVCAMQTGFADQSHLNRHFKRLAVVTPGQYLNSKIVQDSSTPD